MAAAAAAAAPAEAIAPNSMPTAVPRCRRHPQAITAPRKLPAPRRARSCHASVRWRCGARCETWASCPRPPVVPNRALQERSTGRSSSSSLPHRRRLWLWRRSVCAAARATSEAWSASARYCTACLRSSRLIAHVRAERLRQRVEVFILEALDSRSQRLSPQITSVITSHDRK